MIKPRPPLTHEEGNTLCKMAEDNSGKCVIVPADSILRMFSEIQALRSALCTTDLVKYFQAIRLQ